MKKLISLLNATACLGTLVLCGAEPKDRVCRLTFDQAATGVLYAEDGTEASPATTFQIECSHDQGGQRCHNLRGLDVVL